MIAGRELIIDNFAGGGGASLGIEMAIGRPPDVAINHDPDAVAMHAANHPETRHYAQNIWQIDPRDVVGGRPVGLAWFSPDCRHFSKAKGGKPVEKRIRDLAWVVVHWARMVRPRIIMLENVEEFRHWGPLIEAEGGKMLPCPLRKGITYRRWKGELVRLGYCVEERELRACDYGAQTIRKRLFVIARCDGQPIVWPAPTHARDGARGLKPWRTAAECIDWSLPCPSIFLSSEEARVIGVKRPLADATLRRIVRGIRRYVIEAERPFIVPTPEGIAAPTVVPTANGGSLVAAFMAKHYTGGVGSRLDAPGPTITAINHNALVAASPRKLRGSVAAFLAKYYGSADHGQAVDAPAHTVSTHDRLGLVTVSIGEDPFFITDIGMRMLTPRELFRVQGFPDTYVIDPPVNGRPLSRTAQVRLCGNSVCPPVAAALVAANVVRHADDRIGTWHGAARRHGCDVA